MAEHNEFGKEGEEEAATYQAEYPGKQERIRIIADTDCDILHSNFNRM